MQATHFLKHSYRFWVFVIAAALLAGCGLQAVKTGGTASRQRADALYASGDYQPAANMYQQLAVDAAPGKKAPLLLHAGEAWARAEQPQKALQALNAIPAGSLSHDDGIHRALLKARLGLAEQRPQLALDALNKLLDSEPPKATRTTALKLRGHALFALGKPAIAIESLMQRASLLSGSDALHANRQLIWQGLTQSQQPLTEVGPPSSDAEPAVAGWLALGEIGRTAWQSPYRFEQRVSEWQKQYPQHPANGPFIDKLLRGHAQRVAYPDTVAVLLPLGRQGSTRAAAVRGGLLAARYTHDARETGEATPPLIRFYDTQGSRNGTVSAYRKATADGAKVIVGPITQNALEALVDADAITAPTLALTDLPHNTVSPAPDRDFVSFFNFQPNRPTPEATHPLLYQFGFEAADEARQVAERAVRDGRGRGVVLAPETARGERLVKAFRQRLDSLGGTLLEVRHYQPDRQDVARPIKQLLNLNLSRMRVRTLESVIGRDVTSAPRRRQDVQFIFLIADYNQARLIRPRIRYHHGLGLPIYATSAVHQITDNPGYDLNGVMFPDMPWVLSADDSAIAGVRKQLKHLWPRRFNSESRYYALGYDAYRLVPLILHLDSPLAAPVRGVTGLLTIDDNQRIHREYDWATYHQGRVRMLAQPAKPNQ